MSRYKLVVIRAGGEGLTAACRAAELGGSRACAGPYHGENSGMAGG